MPTEIEIRPVAAECWPAALCGEIACHPELSKFLPPPPPGPLWLEEWRGEKLAKQEPNIPVLVAAWQRGSHLYFRPLTDRIGEWRMHCPPEFDHTEAPSEVAFVSAVACATALVMMRQLARDPSVIAERMIKVAKASALPSTRAEENNYVRWVRRHTVGYDRRAAEADVTVEAVKLLWLTSDELYAGFVKDTPSCAEGRRLEMALASAVRLVYKREIDAEDIHKEKRVDGVHRGWSGMYWASNSWHRPGKEQE